LLKVFDGFEEVARFPQIGSQLPVEEKQQPSYEGDYYEISQESV